MFLVPHARHGLFLVPLARHAKHAKLIWVSVSSLRVCVLPWRAPSAELARSRQALLAWVAGEDCLLGCLPSRSALSRRSARFLRALHSLNTRLLCNMQRKLGCRGRKKKREDNRGEYLLLPPFSASCVGVARAASVVQVTSVRGASTWVLVRTSARGSH